MKDEPEDSPALSFLQAGWDAIPRRSWRNRNGAMQQMLNTALTSGMNFQEDDFKKIYSRFNAGHWIGQSREDYYASACAAQSGCNTSAAIAWEKYQGRPPVLWAEATPTPDRLHVGSQFNWKGMRLRVTSMSTDYLIGCSYKDRGIINRRVKVEYSSIKSARKEFDAAREKWITEIRSAKTIVDLEAVSGRFSDKEYFSLRHFDIEGIRKAYQDAKQEFKKAAENAENEDLLKKHRAAEARLAETHDADLERWLNGEHVRRYFNEVRLRVVGEHVETTTGFEATVQGVREVLPFVKSRRKKGWKANGEKKALDEFPISRIDARGVQVGCTLVPWSEVDRISKLLTK